MTPTRDSARGGNRRRGRRLSPIHIAYIAWTFIDVATDACCGSFTMMPGLHWRSSEPSADRAALRSAHCAPPFERQQLTEDSRRWKSSAAQPYADCDRPVKGLVSASARPQTAVRPFLNRLRSGHNWPRPLTLTAAASLSASQPPQRAGLVCAYPRRRPLEPGGRRRGTSRRTSKQASPRTPRRLRLPIARS